MQEPSSEQVSRLPLWAREYIQSLTNQREEAICALDRTLNQQMPQDYRTEEIICTETPPRHITRYIKAPHGIIAKYNDLEVHMRVDAREGGIRVKLTNSTWGAAFQPMSFGEIFIFEAERPKGDK